METVSKRDMIAKKIKVIKLFDLFQSLSKTSCVVGGAGGVEKSLLIKYLRSESISVFLSSLI